MQKRSNHLLQILCTVLLLIFSLSVTAQDNRTFKVFQFPADRIPTIDGKTDDWALVPDSFAIGMDQMVEDTHTFSAPDPKNLDIKVKVGWVKGLNRLYFLYDAYDNYWDFSRTDLHNDVFEVVVDGDRSGGPLIEDFHPIKEMAKWETYFSYHGVHAQNYHIFTPALGKDWTMVWGSQPWIKELPYANAAYNYHFKPGEPGRLVLEFWITPFDYAGAEGPQRAVESLLYENKTIGLSWAVIDYDDSSSENKKYFWNLAREHKMYGNANFLLPFRLMPLDRRFQKPIEARWSFQVVDMDRRLVVFRDESAGKIRSWKWDFGDGTTSTEQHPLHAYKDPGKYVVVLYVEGPEGKSRLSKVWDVAVK